jgi:RNA polymerase sigma-70 factor (ECF subfamily)
MTEADFISRCATYRGYLLRVATRQLRDNDLAEDVVQDTLLAALQGATGFCGRSSLKTWLIGILKHRIVDTIRRKAREPSFATLEEECQLEDFDALFDDAGHWENPPAEWGDPEVQLSRQQFFNIVQSCLEKLPPNTARVFMMREVMELTSDEICKELTITSTNLFVILYRARVALRQCLEQNWFAQTGQTRQVLDRPLGKSPSAKGDAGKMESSCKTRRSITSTEPISAPSTKARKCGVARILGGALEIRPSANSGTVLNIHRPLYRPVRSRNSNGCRALRSHMPSPQAIRKELSDA